MTDTRRVPSSAVLARRSTQLLRSCRPTLGGTRGHLHATITVRSLAAALTALYTRRLSTYAIHRSPDRVRIALTDRCTRPLQRTVAPPATSNAFAFTGRLRPAARRLLSHVVAFDRQTSHPVTVCSDQNKFITHCQPSLNNFVGG